MKLIKLIDDNISLEEIDEDFIIKIVKEEKYLIIPSFLILKMAIYLILIMI